MTSLTTKPVRTTPMVNVERDNFFDRFRNKAKL